VLLCAALAASQIEQHIFRRKAERLLADVQALELRQTPWSDVQSLLQRWRPDIDSRFPCNDSECSIIMDEAVFSFLHSKTFFLRLDDYLRWRMKLSYEEGPFIRAEERLLPIYIRLGGRLALVSASFAARQGILWSKNFSINIWVDNPDLFAGNVYGLFAAADTVPRFIGSPANSIAPQVELHPNYTIGGPDGCEVCIAGWVKFTPYANSADIHRLMQFDLSCLTRFHQCFTQTDVMPVAWKQYEAESPQLQEMWDKPPGCSPSVLELLGRDSIKVATGEVTGAVRNDHIWPTGIRDGHVPIRVLAALKGLPDWKPGQIRIVHITAASSGQEAELHKGKQLILFGAWGGRHAQIEIDLPRGGCSIVPLNGLNLTLVQRGIAQDYSADN
jgi:hypothetical protein